MIHYITTNGIGNAWVAAELEAMERKGIPFVLHSLHRPHQNFFGSDWAARLDRETRLLYPLSPAGFALSLLLAPWLFGLAFWAGLGNALFGPRESFAIRLKTLAHFFVACHWARSLRRQKVSLIHAQWVHSAGSVAMYGAWLLGVPFSFTGHAADLFRDRIALVDKVRRAEFIVCISEFHRRLYLDLGARPEQLHLVYCGIDAEQFPYTPTARPRRRILSVGRLVEKKGLPVLLDACAALKLRGVPFECVIAGNGPMAEPLRRQVEALGLSGEAQILDRAIPQEELPGLLAEADVFAQPCVWSKDNDVDGTPRTLLEAMATGLPCVATRIAGLPDLVEDGRAGLLVEPGDSAGLADALERLLTDEEEAARLGRSGRQIVEDRFRIDDCLEPLAELFRGRLEGQAVAPMEVLV